MEPRKTKYKKKRVKQNLRLLKVLTSSVAISSLLIGGGKVTTPTYGSFTSSNNKDIEVSACFIFPSEVIKKRDRSSVLNTEALKLTEELLEKVRQIDVSAVTDKIGSLMESNSNSSQETAPNNSTVTDLGDAPTIEVLQSQIANIHSQITAIESNIQANNEKSTELENVITELGELKSQFELILQGDFPGVQEELNVKFNEIEEIISFLLEVKERAISDCEYKPEFFDIILEEIEGFKENLEMLINNVLEEAEATQNQILNIDTQIADLQEIMIEVNEQSLNLAAEIEALKASISNIEQQIIVLKEQERLKKLEMERLEKERLEKERLEKERLEKERLEKERLEQERLAKELEEETEKEETEEAETEEEETEEEGTEEEGTEEEGTEEEGTEEETEEEGTEEETEEEGTEEETEEETEEGTEEEETEEGTEEEETEEEGTVDEEGDSSAPTDPKEENDAEEIHDGEVEEGNRGEQEHEEEENKKDEPEENVYLNSYLNVINNEGKATFQAVANMYRKKDEEVEEDKKEKEETTIVVASKFGVRPN